MTGRWSIVHGLRILPVNCVNALEIHRVFRPLRSPFLLHRHRNLLRHHRRLVGDVVFVPEQQLQGVDARLQHQRGFRLAFPEMDMVFVGGDRHVRRRQFLRIDQQVMMPGVGVVDACGRDAHAFQAKHDMHLAALDGGAVFGTNDIRRRAFGRRGAGHLLREGRLGKESAGDKQAERDAEGGAKKRHGMRGFRSGMPE